MPPCVRVASSMPPLHSRDADYSPNFPVKREKLVFLKQRDHCWTVPLVLLPLHAISLLLPSFSSPGKRKAYGYFRNLVEYIFAHVSKQQISHNLCTNNFIYSLSFLKAWNHGLKWLEKSLDFLNCSIERESLWWSFKGMPFKIKLKIGFRSNQDSKSSGLNRYTLL